VNLLKDERGSVVVIVTLAMTVILGITSLVTDVGLMYLTRTKLQTMVDAAALAGMQDIPKGFSVAQETTKQWAIQNGAKEEELQITGTGNEMKLTIKADRKVNLLFARVLGIQSSNITAQATAQAGYMTAMIGVSPLGIEEQQLDYGRLYTLKTGAPPTMGAGEFGALVLGNPGADDYEKFLTYGYDGQIQIGQILSTQTGNISNPTVRAIENRFLRDTRVPKNSISAYDRDAPQILLVPIYQPYEVISNQIRKVKVTGFAAFFVTQLSGQGVDNYLNGYFIRTVSPGDSKFSQKDYGLMGVKLIN